MTVGTVLRVLALVALLIAYRHKDNLHLLRPYLMMINNDREATVRAWSEAAPIDTRITYAAVDVPEIQAADFSIDILRKATDNFRLPAVVRGLFKDSRAVQLWNSRDYLPRAFGDDLEIPVVQDGRVGTLQNNRSVETFGNSFREVFDSEHTKKYLFFPVKSRYMFNGSAASTEELQLLVDRVIRADVNLDKIFPGFSSPSHKTFVGGQFVIGKSTEEHGNKSTGSDWHCAVGNNYFVQVVGRKKWEFIAPENSPMLWPLKGGLLNMWTGNKNIAKVQSHIPRFQVILQPGDMVYNPVWMWHKITNFGGLSIGLPIRESQKSHFKNNYYFSFIVISNKILNAVFGFGWNGYPPPSAATEADNE